MNIDNERFNRTELLLGNDSTKILQNAKVLVIGVGGVGGYAVENIARAGVGHLTMVDGDNVDISNCNRQIIALNSTIGLSKAELFAQRCKEINPQGIFIPEVRFLHTAQDISELLDRGFDFVVDAIDDVPVKVELLTQLKKRKIPCISAMGAGGKIDPSGISITDISKTHSCPLARVIRSRLKAIGITKGIKVVFSPEMPERSFENKKIGSISYLPAIFGCFCAYEAIFSLLKEKNSSKK